MSDFETHEIAPVIGSEVHGLDLAKPLAQETIDRIGLLLAERHVLVFRGQDLTPDEQLAFGRHFGDVYCPAMSAYPPEHPDIMLLDTTTPKGAGADAWHYDATFMPEPPMGAILRPVQLPSSGGDTCFASMTAAWDALSPTLQSMLEGMTAVHDLARRLEVSIERGIAPESYDEIRSKWPPIEHPVVRTHPVTGRKALFLNGNTGSRLVGLTERENDLLLPFLLDHVRDPAFQCRVRWAPDMVLFWDNRATQHYGVADYDERRIMHRVTVAGDKPY